MPINHRRGPCRFCGKPVGRGKGRAARSAHTGIWLAWHERCDPAPNRPAGRESDKAHKPPPEPPPARKPYYMDDDE